MRDSDPDAYDSLIDFLSQQFVSRLTLNKTQSQKAKGYVFEIITTCFSRDIPMHGYDGVKKVLEEFKSPALGIDRVGNLATDEYIKDKDRENLANATNALLTGAGTQAGRWARRSHCFGKSSGVVLRGPSSRFATRSSVAWTIAWTARSSRSGEGRVSRGAVARF